MISWEEHVWAQVSLKGNAAQRICEQPEVIELRLQFSDWVVGELTRSHA